MKKFYYRLCRRKKSEDGQSMVEFVLILPIFIFFLAMIFDFGWLFYNLIALENSARNAARIACVEYTYVANESAQDPSNLDKRLDKKEYNLDDYEGLINNVNNNVEITDKKGLTDQEINILRQVYATKPPSISHEIVTISYSYDKDWNNNLNRYYAYSTKDRRKGDVTVIVSGTHKAITPLVNWDVKPGESRMERQVKCKSVYKVEENVSFDDELGG